MRMRSSHPDRTGRIRPGDPDDPHGNAAGPPVSSLRTHAGIDARLIVLARALRGFADGLVSVLLAGYLTLLGFTPFEVGAIVTGTLLGSAALTIALGLAGHRLPRRPLLLGA